jgi:mono/diheme cytochrome c family protein
MRPNTVSNIAFLLVLIVTAIGCGGDDRGFDPNESETSKAIREKVRARMEVERLQRLAPRVASANAAAAASPSASGVAWSGEESDEAAASEPVGERGSAIYAQNCSSCHGLRGAGDGPVGASLNPQPAKHSDGAYMNALTNEYLFKVIEQGGGAVGKSPTMAAWGATMSNDQINDVIAFVRSLAEPPYTGDIP